MDVVALEAEADAVRRRLDRIVAQADLCLATLDARRRMRSRVMDAARRRARQTALLLG